MGTGNLNQSGNSGEGMMNDINEIVLGDKINSGSNSNIYEVESINGQNVNSLVAKCSKNAENYISFNLQYHSYRTCRKIFNMNEYIVPRMYFCGKYDRIGDILLMDKMDGFFDIDFIINGSFYYGDLVIKEIARAIAQMHNNKISGFDVELYWNPKENKLVLLDIGPMFTFDLLYNEMLLAHWNMEKENAMGRWNIISQILKEEDAKEIYESGNMENISLEYIMHFIDENTMSFHIENVAKVHALSVFGKLAEPSRKRYLDIFIKEYEKNIQRMSINNIKYIKELKSTILKKTTKAKAKLYYSKAEKTLSEESCSAELSSLSGINV